MEVLAGHKDNAEVRLGSAGENAARFAIWHDAIGRNWKIKATNEKKTGWNLEIEETHKIDNGNKIKTTLTIT